MGGLVDREAGAEAAGRETPGREAAGREAQRGYAKGRAKRQEILDQAMALFGETGYRGASLREIAARCGLSHPGVLHHFPTKESLLLAVLEHRDEADRVRLSGGSGLAVLRGLVDLTALNATRPGIVELFVVLSAEATAEGHPAHDYFVHRYQTTVRAMEQAYQQAQADGALRSGIDVQAAARQLVAIMDGLQIQWLLSDRQLDMTAILRAHLENQLSADAPPLG